MHVIYYIQIDEWGGEKIIEVNLRDAANAGERWTQIR